MDEEKDTKPKLDYEQVVEYIDERITRIEQAAEQLEAEKIRAESENKHVPCRFRRCWTKCCRHLKGCFSIKRRKDD